jgi:hypothetical protein
MTTGESSAAIGGLKAWATRRTRDRIWTRTDTARWLDDRRDGCIAWAKHTLGLSLRYHPKYMGAWIQVRLGGSFDVAHAHLAEMTEERRAASLAKDVLPAGARAAVDSEPPFPTAKKK